MLFANLKQPRGRNVLILGGGGGNSVAVTDTCGREGLVVPTITEATRKELSSFIRFAGNSVRNPLDVWQTQEEFGAFRHTIEIAMSDPNIDIVLLDRFVGIYGDAEEPNYKRQDDEINNYIIELAHEKNSKPMVVSMNLRSNNPRTAATGVETLTKFAKAGVPAFPSPASASRALSRFVSYFEFQDAEK